jgi:hypothetical protein
LFVAANGFADGVRPIGCSSLQARRRRGASIHNHLARFCKYMGISAGLPHN